MRRPPHNRSDRPSFRPPIRAQRGSTPEGIPVDSLSAVAHVLAYKPERILSLEFTRPEATLKGRLAELCAKAKHAQVRVSFSDGAPALAPATAWLKPFPFADFATVLEKVRSLPRATVLILDHLQDPQNLGAILRNAEALGAAAVIVPKDRTVPIAAGVYAASVGAVETLTLCEYNLGEAARRLKEEGFWVASAAKEDSADVPQNLAKFEKLALVLGGEFDGVSQGLAKLSDFTVAIPMRGRIESLNVSAATAILLYERMRGDVQ